MRFERPKHAFLGLEHVYEKIVASMLKMYKDFQSKIHPTVKIISKLNLKFSKMIF